MRLRRLGMRTRLRAGAGRVAEIPHWFGLRGLAKERPADYRDYLAVQLRRTLSKRDTDPGIGAVTLINAVSEAQPSARRVLCVGARNTLELERFRARGFPDVVGIDLFSQHEHIKVMDMHELTFADDSFDIVYCSHALEHSYDVARVASELVRVAREDAVIGAEVPVRAQASAADRVVFSGLDELRALFAQSSGDEILAEEQPARSATNEQGTDIARLVFRVHKRRE